MAQQTQLSDGNHRTTAQAYLRLALAPGLYAAYSGTHIAFSDRSTRYWDPIEYTAHAAGLEIATHAVRGLSGSLRVLPGTARSVEAPPPTTGRSRTPQPTENITHSAFQLSGGGDLTWRDPSWEGVAAVTYGQGRTGDYRRLGITLGVRVTQ
jgi:hypothetical protein